MNLIRKFIRHPSSIPIQVSTEASSSQNPVQARHELSNISLGGLAFIADHAIAVGQYTQVSIPVLGKNSVFRGQVVWCQQEAPERFEIGLQFDDADSLYRMRMVEQVCHIEHYRREVEQQQHRSLSSNEAAQEWISRYAGDFPTL